MGSFNFWQFLAGIAVFIYAMSLIESSLRNLAGRPFKKFLQKQSKSKFKMLAASTFVTAILQSSSVVLLMVLSFVGAGLLSMRGALAAVLGSNLGTTLDSWVIAILGFKINFSALSYPILSVALVGLLFIRKNSRFFHLNTFLIGFAFVFIALDWLKGSADRSMAGSFGSLVNLHYLYFVPVGFIITAIIQSSFVTVALSLTALYNHLIPFESAACVVIGSELGTTLKFLIGSVGGIPDKKRVAWGNFMLNTATMIIAIVFLHPLVYLIRQVVGIKDQLLALVMFQSGINLLSILVFYPVLGNFANLLDRLFKNLAIDHLTDYIRKTTVALPGDALALAAKETIHLMGETIELNMRVLAFTGEKRRGWLRSMKELASDSFSVSETYKKMKILEGEILEYISEIPKNEMSEAEAELTGRLINITRHVMRSAKNLKDIRHNLEEFEATANDDLFSLFSLMKEKAKEFYHELQLLIHDPDKITVERIRNLSKENRKQYDDAIANLLIFLKDKKISELDSSTILNVYREFYSSNKALIRVLADLKDVDIED